MEVLNSLTGQQFMQCVCLICLAAVVAVSIFAYTWLLVAGINNDE